MEIKEYSPEDFGALEKIWKNLETGEDMTVFQSYEWYRWLNSAYSSERVKRTFREWIYLVCSENGQAKMIAPIQIVKRGFCIHGIGLKKGAYFIGRVGPSDYLNFIYRGFDVKAIETILDYLKKQYNIKLFTFEKLLTNTDSSVFLCSKYDIDLIRTIPAVSLILPLNLDAYNSLLKKHAKQNFRTAINRQNRDGYQFEHEMVYSISPEQKRIILNIREQRVKEKRKNIEARFSSRVFNFARERIICKFNANVDLFDCPNSQWCFLVKDKDRIIGFFWGIRDVSKKCYYAVLAGVDEEYSWYSPSISHLHLWIKEQYEKDEMVVNIIDFTLGEEKYKFDIGGCLKELKSFRITI